ncbi:MAG TPA: alpha/beta hydrolase [Xanthobacteraceae bacterium]|nr:alpha/beta hydrolase [Xanthobacteraceae bacterium]
MPERVTIMSEGLKLAGVLNIPAGLKPGERRPAFVVLHGFGGNKEGEQGVWASKTLLEWGYVCLQIDFRGCGESEGEPARIVPQEEVTDAQSAISFLETRPEVDPKRIALCGSSLGAAVSIVTAGMDSRVAAVISQGGWGSGPRKFMQQHPPPEKWNRFVTMMIEGVRHREKTGKSMKVPRFDIVPVPERLRDLVRKGHMEFTAETPLGMFLFHPENSIAAISPRPVLLLHAVGDSVTPTTESLELYRNAKSPVELHLIDGADHFMFAESNPRVANIVKDWLGAYFPLKAN